MTHRTRLAIAAVVLIVFGVVVLSVCVHHDTAPEPSAVPPVLKLDEGGLRFTFHVLSGDEGLFDLQADPKMLKNLRVERPDDFRRMKEEFRKRVKSQYDCEPAALRTRPELIDRLRGHPYF